MFHAIGVLMYCLAVRYLPLALTGASANFEWL